MRFGCKLDIICGRVCSERVGPQINNVRLHEKKEKSINKFENKKKPN